MKITVKIKGARAHIYTPYNKAFVSKIKRIGGSEWDGMERCWIIPASELDIARKYMQEEYGETDLPDDEERVTVDVKFCYDEYETTSSICLFGRPVIKAWGRDSGARTCEDVTLIEGRIYSAGSMKYWETCVEKGTVLRIKNLTRAALELEPDYEIEITEVQKPGADVEALMIEKEKLLARLAEIDKILGKEDKEAQ